MGVRDSIADILSWELGELYISMLLKNNLTNLVWRLIAVYGSPYEEGKQKFIDELHATMEKWSGPTLVGGDFNIVRLQNEKNNGNINHRWADEMTNWINKWGLIEYKSPNRSYTWCNNQEQPIMATLDKIFGNTELAGTYPLARVKTASRDGSDHVPLIFHTGEDEVIKPKLFRFENWWLEREDFHTLVNKVWNAPCSLTNPIDIWQHKIRLLRKKLKVGPGMLMLK